MNLFNFLGISSRFLTPGIGWSKLYSRRCPAQPEPLASLWAWAAGTAPGLGGALVWTLTPALCA